MQYIVPHWPAPKQIKAYTTLRSAWGERKSHYEMYKGNNGNMPYIEESKHLESLLSLPESPIWLNQIHSNIAIEATPLNNEKQADASFTKTHHRVCVVLTADCLPVLICNKQGTQVAAIHAGWRGLAAGVIENTIEAFKDEREDLLVWLGPAIGPTKFEVGQDVYDAFTQKHAESKAAFLPYKEGKWLANLYDLAKIRLKLYGIQHIYGGEFCTFTQEDLFFSYRRDGKTGRMASLIWINGVERINAP